MWRAFKVQSFPHFKGYAVSSQSGNQKERIQTPINRKCAKESMGTAERF
jgi:hypothetical protein